MQKLLADASIIDGRPPTDVHEWSEFRSLFCRGARHTELFPSPRDVD
jgi:hypothetical protein